MGLRKRTLVNIGVTFWVLIVTLAAISEFILLGSFRDLEEQTARLDVERVLAAITEQTDSLSATLADWAVWDDTYRFVTDGNPAYIESNLVDSTFHNLDLNLIAMVDRTGKVIYGRGYDTVQSLQTPLPADFEEYVRPASRLLEAPNEAATVSGIVMLRDGPMLVAARPILTSKGNGPAHGTLIMGRYLNEERLRRVASALRLTIDTFRADRVDGPEDVLAVRSKLSASRPITLPRSENVISGYALLNDLNSNPAIILRVSNGRIIHAMGLRTRTYFLLAVAGAVLLLCAAIIYLLERQVLNRITGLSRTVRRIALTRDLSHRVSVGGSDELTILADSINTMLEEIEHSQRTLEENELQLREMVEMVSASEANYRAIFDAATDAIFVLDAETGEILDANEQVCRLYGYSPEEIPELDLLAPFSSPEPGQTVEELQRRLALAASGEPQTFEWMARDKSGRSFPVEVTLRHALIGGANCLLAFVRDLSERKRLEEQFLQAQKMETIGRLAGGLAHDFNNLLTAISGYANLARRNLPKGSSAIADLDQVLKSAARASGVTKQLLAFSRRQVIALQPMNLNELILDMDKMLRRLIGEDIELVTIPGPDVGCICADRTQIEQALVNLVINARDAMPNGGKLTIETSRVLAGQDGAPCIYDDVKEYVVLTVSDTGVGMTEEVKAHLFEPFFTTKEVGKGTGLGLATVYGIVKQHRGEIVVSSQLGRGTTFRIYLPRVEEPAPVTPEPRDTSSLEGTETVLVVEDDAAVRNFAARALRDYGYTVLEAENGEDALDTAAAYPDEIHLLLTDVVMPRLSGRALADRLRATRPNMKVLFMSGYASDHSVDAEFLREGVAFLAKPFTEEGLATCVRETLGLPLAGSEQRPEKRGKSRE